MQQLLDAGANLAGKTHTDELTFSLNGENAHYGTPVNVNAPGRIPGGSSSGSAAAVAGGLVDFALGSDTGGSVRAPASFCGIYGLRPTHGRVSLEGARPLASSFDTAGWFARDAELMERVGAVLFGEEPDDAMPRPLLVAQDAFELAGPACRGSAATGADRVIARIGWEAPNAVGERRGPAPVARRLPRAAGLRDLGAARRLGEGGEARLGPGIRQRVEWASTIRERDAAQARAKRESDRAAHAALLGTDTVHRAADGARHRAAARDADPKATEDFRARALTLLCIAGLARLPQVNLPVGKLERLPDRPLAHRAADGDMMLLAIATARDG